MTTDDLTRMCPPPEGMEWHEDGYGGFIAQAPNRTLRIDPEAEERIRVSAWNVDDNVHFFATLTDLPSAYRRALQAVGLASPWTSEVPTQPGDYLVDVGSGMGPMACHLTTDGRWLETFRFNPVLILPDALFMPCPQPPKERP